MNIFRRTCFGLLASVAAATGLVSPLSAQQPQKPNILVIMGDDIGILEHRRLQPRHDGRTARRTSTASPTRACYSPTITPRRVCTAGRANFITGESPIRTGMTKVGQAGAAQACRRRPTIATALKGRATRPASSARTILATTTNSCPRCMASTSSSAISIT